MLKQTLKPLVLRSFPLTCAAYMFSDWWRGLRYRWGDPDSDAPNRSLGETVSHVERNYAWYLALARLPRFGGVVAEIGPGRTLGLGLLCVAGGAREYHGIDRYRPYRDHVLEFAVCEALAAKVGRRDLLKDPAGTGIAGVQYHPGQPAETFFRDIGPTFDAILSSATLEHLYDPLGALDHMLAALRPGGIMVHMIDHKHHGMFPGRHKLTFLTIPDRVYHRMVRNTGRPNRVLFADYRRWLSAGHDGEINVMDLAHEPGGLPTEPPLALNDVPADRMNDALSMVREIRPRLSRRFRWHSDHELAVGFSALVVRAPRV
jgi:SAM-dependent methyltransferase